MDKKINIFCEKPLTKTYSQSLKLFEKAKKNQIRLCVDQIQCFLKKKIKLNKNNYITRQKKGYGSIKNLLFRFAYHDFYFLYDYLKNKKIKNIEIINVKDNLKFKINFEKISILFYYNLNSEKRIHKINSTNLITKKDILSKMIKDVLSEKVDFEDNKNRSLFANKLIDEIVKKL